MNSSRWLYAALCATALLAVIALVRQARTIRDLRAEQAVLREDLRHALTTAMDRLPASSTNFGQREALELIKLRHETRELRESLVEARAKGPTAFKDIIRSLFPAGPPSGPPPVVQYRPEWKGMEQVASNNYARAMQAVNSTNDYARFLSLSGAAKANLAVGRKEEARHFAEDAISLNEKYSRGAPEKLNGDVVHDANEVLGRIALDEGRLEDAKRYLLAASRSTGSPLLGSFGPNMGLAKDLLERGEQATVLEYFELCRKFWPNNTTLDQWKKDVEEGRIPDFGGNLLY